MRFHRHRYLSHHRRTTHCTAWFLFGKLSGSYGIVSTVLPQINLQLKAQTYLLYDGIITMSSSETLIFDNSTAIFNSIRAALRQSPSDIHPVGVSYFPAVIPKGTLMYHAGSNVPTTFGMASYGPRIQLLFRLEVTILWEKIFGKKHGTSTILYLVGASAAKTDSGEMDTQLMLSNVIKKKLNLTMMVKRTE
nr:CIC_HP1_G0049010.mRNA.1.CDS.1 [Saccharomyces cerevisiae]